MKIIADRRFCVGADEIYMQLTDEFKINVEVSCSVCAMRFWADDVSIIETEFATKCPWCGRVNNRLANLWYISQVEWDAAKTQTDKMRLVMQAIEARK